MRIVIRRVLWSAPIVVAAGVAVIVSGDSVRRADGSTTVSPPPSHAPGLPARWAPEDVQPFEGDVEYVVPGDGVLAMADGTTVALVLETEVGRDHPADLGSLEAVHEALEAGWRVRVRGEGLRGPEGTLTATALRAEARVSGFAAPVQALDPSSGGLILEDGSYVQLTDGTQVLDADGARLADLEQIRIALGDGGSMVATGAGYLLTDDDEEPASYQALTVSLGGTTR